MDLEDETFLFLFKMVLYNSQGQDVPVATWGGDPYMDHKLDMVLKRTQISDVIWKMDVD